jgi:hypothetical protein
MSHMRFKGRSSMRQYMPQKPIKWGYKCWCACDTTNGYVYNMDVYQGASANLDEAGLGATVVQRMMEPLYHYHQTPWLVLCGSQHSLCSFHLRLSIMTACLTDHSMLHFYVANIHIVVPCLYYCITVVIASMYIILVSIDGTWIECCKLNLLLCVVPCT